jgi:hypothetical protein
MAGWFPIYTYQRVTGSEVAGFVLHALGAGIASFALAVVSFELYEIMVSCAKKTCRVSTRQLGLRHIVENAGSNDGNY